MKRVIAALVMAGATTAPAFGQSTSPGFIRGFGGVTFMSETGGVFGVGVGVRLTSHLHAIGDVGRLTNMLPDSIQRDLDGAARMMGVFYGVPLSIDGRAPGVYAFGGLRASHAIGRRTTVYAEGGVGGARGTSDIRASAGGTDVSHEVTAALGIKHSDSQPLVAIGAGVSVPVSGRLALDLGYRFMRIFTEDPRIDTGSMSVGLRWGF
jgi:opacity protein-like surface antigen